jgi:hypothetical protein
MLALLAIFASVVAVTMVHAEATPATAPGAVAATSKNAYATIHYEGTPKDAGTHTLPLLARSAVDQLITTNLFLLFLFYNSYARSAAMPFEGARAACMPHSFNISFIYENIFNQASSAIF